MTNREALQAQIQLRVPPVTLDLNLVKNGVEPDAEFKPDNTDNVRGIDLALAGLILFICLSPKSIKELDFMITNQEVKDLLAFRAGILKRYGVDDEMSQDAEITNISDRW